MSIYQTKNRNTGQEKGMTEFRYIKREIETLDKKQEVPIV